MTSNSIDDSPEPTAPQPDSPQQLLDDALKALNSPEVEQRLAAAQQLAALAVEDERALRALERTAGHDENEAVREAAFQALEVPLYRTLQRRLSRLSSPIQWQILAEIERWQTDGLISGQTARLLRQRYDFSHQAVTAIPAPAPAADEPRPTLSQLLLSETAIKVALYLGAFFVISAACILTAIIELLRLPILGVMTLGFLGAALGLKRRLPQASFILFIVFTFLLPIDAGVLLDQFEITGDPALLFGIGVSFFLSLIWLGGTVFYSSRFLSILTLLGATATAWQLGSWLDLDDHLTLFLMALPTLLALGGVYLLARWRDRAFVRPLLGVAQLQQVGILTLSVVLLFIAFIDDDLPAAGWWAVIAATWLLGSAFYVGSHRLSGFALFPLLAVGALLPVPSLLSGVLSPSALLVAGVTCGWGVGVALVGEVLARLKAEFWRPYSLYLLAGSVLLFISATLIALPERVLGGLICLLVATGVYAALTVYRPRTWSWSAALVAGLAAYLTFFFLPTIEAYEFYPGFIGLWPTLVLLAVGLAARRGLKAQSHWVLPPLALAALVGLGTVLVLLATGYDQPGRATLSFILLGGGLALFSLFDRQPQVGYGATASLALALAYFLGYLEQTSWVLPFIGLASLYYLAGLALKFRYPAGGWAMMLRWSGLILGTVVALSAPAQGGASAVIGAALAATLFTVEAFLRRDIWLGFPANLLYLVAYFTLLVELEVSEPQVYSIGAALLGFIMHYLLVREHRNSWAAFFTGLLSQFILLGTTYIQMISTDSFLFFFVLFAEALVVLVYGLVIRSRSLVIAPILFVVLGVITVTLSALAGLPALILVGCTGFLLLVLGIVALLQRERLLQVSNTLGERLGGWQA